MNRKIPVFRAGGILSLLVSLAAPCLGAGFPLFKSGPIQITGDGVWVWVADIETDRVYRIDTRDDTVSEFELDPAVKDFPTGISVTEDGSQVWVAAHDSDRVYVLDGSSGSIVDTLELPWGSGPYSVALSRPDPGNGTQNWALVTLHRAEALAAIDTASRQVTDIEHVFLTPTGIAWTEAGDAAWVTHLMVIGEHPKLTRVDFSSASPFVSTRLEIGRANPVSPVAGRMAEGGYLNWRGHPAQLPSAAAGGLQELWIPTQYANMNGSTPSIDSTTQSSLRKLDLTVRSVSPTDKIILSALDVHDPQGSNAWQGYGWDAQVSGPVDVGFADVRGTLFSLVLHEQSNDVVVFPFDTQPLKSTVDPNAPGLPEITVGDRPMGLVVSPVSDIAYVYNSLSSDVSVLDLSSLGVVRTIPFPTRVDPQDPLVVGAKLFHTSDDDRISVNRKVSCASCHINAEHDGRTWSFENTPPGTAGQGHGPRSTITLRDLSLTFAPGLHPTYGWGQLHHSGDRDEVQDFDHTFAGISFGGTGFLDPIMERQPELGPPNAGINPDLDAIATYLFSLAPLPKSPHRESAGGLSEAALRGATFFVGNDPANFPADANCAGCHNPDTAFLDFEFHDVGQRRPGSEQELNNRNPAWHVNTLTLVGAWNTPPYDGVLRFAEEFIPALKDFSDPSYGRTVNHGELAGLTGRQLADIAEFVLSIDGNMANNPGEVWNARDSVAPTIVRVEAPSPTLVNVWFSETVDPGSAGTASSYRIQRNDNQQVYTVASAQWSGQNGDRVDLTIEPPLDTAATRVGYTLSVLGSIFDASDWTSASQGIRNALDPADPANRRSFVVTDTFTMTMGASGYENVTVTVHDASPIQGLNNWAHDRVQISHFPNSARTPGFLRFDWRGPFLATAGTPLWTPTSANIVDARFSLKAHLGDSQEVEIRRTLQSWADPNDCTINGIRLTGSSTCADWNNNPTGAPTWNSSSHGTRGWNQGGASALGGTGTVPGDYNGQWDLSNVVDATARVAGMEVRTEFSDPNITDAFRFWFDNPTLDYGYAFRINRTPPAAPVVMFYRWEDDLQEHGPVLTLTYQVPETTSAPVPEVSGFASAVPLRVEKVGGNSSGQLSFSFEDLFSQVDSYNFYMGTLQAPFSSHVSVACHQWRAGLGVPQLGVLESTRNVLGGSYYYLVTASNTSMEGTAGFQSDRQTERDPSRLTCGPN